MISFMTITIIISCGFWKIVSVEAAQKLPRGIALPFLFRIQFFPVNHINVIPDSLFSKNVSWRWLCIAPWNASTVWRSSHSCGKSWCSRKGNPVRSLSLHILPRVRYESIVFHLPHTIQKGWFKNLSLKSARFFVKKWIIGSATGNEISTNNIV